MNYSRITPVAGMVMKRPSVMISLSGRVPGRASEPSRTRVDDGGGDGHFSGIVLGYLGFSRRGDYIGERAASVEARGGRATLGWGRPLVRLRLPFDSVCVTKL